MHWQHGSLHSLGHAKSIVDAATLTLPRWLTRAVLKGADGSNGCGIRNTIVLRGTSAYASRAPKSGAAVQTDQKSKSHNQLTRFYGRFNNRDGSLGWLARPSGFGQWRRGSNATMSPCRAEFGDPADRQIALRTRLRDVTRSNTIPAFRPYQ